MTDPYDVVVVGAGSGGLAAARAARRAGRSVALVEAARPGGDCTWTGCVPSKTLIETARTVHRARAGADRGVRAEVEVDGPAALAHVRATMDEVAQDESPALLRRQGIDLVPGRARFLDRHVLDVDGRRLHARRVVLATGGRPRLPAVEGLADLGPLTSETVWDLPDLPRRLVVVGGGPIGCELAQTFRRLGAAVTLLQSGERLLPRDEPAAGAVLADVLRREGVDLRLGRRAQRAQRRDGSAVLRLDDGSEATGEHVLVATGRRPSTADLDLEAAGVATDADGRVLVDDRLRSRTAGHVWAVGDCAARLAFTHVADEQGRLVVTNLLADGAPRLSPTGLKALPATWSDEHVPWVTYTDPEVAHVGLTEAQAHERYGSRARVARVPMAAMDRPRTAGETDGFVQLVAAPSPLPVTPLLRLVGATVVSAGGGELLAQAGLAQRAGTPVFRLAQTIAPYPTWSIAVRVAAALFFGPYGGLRDRPARPG